jgi:hypothetical protein
MSFALYLRLYHSVKFGDRGLAEVGDEGIVFAQGDGGGIDLDAATGVPLGEQLVGWLCFGAVGDADHGGGLLAGATGDGLRPTRGQRGARAAAVAEVGEHLQFELAGELSHAGGKVGTHQLGGVGEVATIGGQGDVVAVALEDGGAGDIGDAIVWNLNFLVFQRRWIRDNRIIAILLGFTVGWVQQRETQHYSHNNDRPSNSIAPP